MVAAARIVALVLAGLATHACTPVCDEPGLRRAAGAFAAGVDRRTEVDELQAACPTLPPALAQGLVVGESSIAAAEDPAWLALLARVCPAATHADGAAAVHEELDGMRRVCDLDRHGLLAADAVFTRDDLFVFALFQWLLDAGVDRSLAAAVAQPLLTAHEFAAQGLTPPRGRTDAPLQPGAPELRLSPTALSLAGVHVLPLAQGRPPPGAFVGHVSQPLLAALTAEAWRMRVQAERAGRPWDDTLRLLVDRATPCSTVLDVAFTAVKAEFTAFQLVVHDGGELHGLTFSPPITWFPATDELRGHDDLNLQFVVGTEDVEAIVGAARDGGKRFPQPAGAAIADYVKRLKAVFPNEVVARYRVADEVPLQALVSLIDTVSGETCEIGRALRGEAVPADCLFWQVVLDSEPALHFAIGEPGAP